MLYTYFLACFSAKTITLSQIWGVWNPLFLVLEQSKSETWMGSGRGQCSVYWKLVQKPKGNKLDDWQRGEVIETAS